MRAGRTLTACSRPSRWSAGSLRSADDFHRAVYDTQRHAAESGVRYREMFWNPTDHWSIGEVGYAEAADGMIAGLRDAERDFGITGRLIPSIDRESSPELGFEMVEAVVAHPRDEVIGIGMDYLEVGNPPEKFWKSYRLAERNGLRRTAHAGEFGEPARNVETALDLLGCDRIDHGLHHIAGRATACALPRRGDRLHRGPDQLVLQPHASGKGFLGAPSDSAHGRRGIADHAQQRRSAAASHRSGQGPRRDGDDLRAAVREAARLRRCRDRRRLGGRSPRRRSGAATGLPSSTASPRPWAACPEPMCPEPAGRGCASGRQGAFKPPEPVRSRGRIAPLAASSCRREARVENSAQPRGSTPLDASGAA